MLCNFCFILFCPLLLHCLGERSEEFHSVPQHYIDETFSLSKQSRTERTFLFPKWNDHQTCILWRLKKIIGINPINILILSTLLCRLSAWGGIVIFWCKCLIQTLNFDILHFSQILFLQLWPSVPVLCLLRISSAREHIRWFKSNW